MTSSAASRAVAGELAAIVALIAHATALSRHLVELERAGHATLAELTAIHAEARVRLADHEREPAHAPLLRL